MIEPRTLKGFRDLLPAQAMAREQILETARRVYRSYGFAPIDTPALEYLEILTGKGSEETDKQLYRFTDNGGREVGLRFDLTVPFARFCAQHIGQLSMPFKRYHLASVWRGENTQRGRYREFMQCDFDTIGTVSPVADLEMVLVVHDLLAAIGLEKFTVRLNDRRVLGGVLDELGLSHCSTAVLRSLDKLGKATPQAVAVELESGGLSAEKAEKLLAMAMLSGPSKTVLEALQTLVGRSEIGQTGVAALRAVLDGVKQAGLADGRVIVDPSIARGLDYYTGIVLESFLEELPTLGSICSGGRYDNLAGVYTTQKLPGVGASLGVDRLLTALEELGRLGKKETPAQILVTQFEAASLGHYFRIASLLRKAGLLVEVFPEAKKIGQQLQYAEKRGHPLAVIAGPEELALGSWKLKNLSKRTESSFAEAELAEAAKRELTS